MSETPQASGTTGATGSDAADGAAALRRLVESIDSALLVKDSPAPSGETPHPSDSSSGAGDRLLAGADPVPVEAGGDGALHLVFELAGSFFAIPAVGLVEVKPFAAPMPIPGVPPWILGIESFQGETLSITDLAAFLGFSSFSPSDSARTVVVHDPRRERRRPLTGLAVDAVVTHELLPASETRSPGGLRGRLGRFTRRVIDLEGRVVAELDLDALLGSEDFLNI